jgi:cysteine-rich repeat protein
MLGIGVVLLLLGAACGRGRMQVRGPDASAVPDAVDPPDARDGALDSAQVDPRSTDGRPTDEARFDLPAEGTQPSCGNGSYDPSEACDDGNRLSGDGCSATCQLECGDAGVEPCIDPGFFPESPW